MTAITVTATGWMVDMGLIKINDIWLSEAPQDVIYNEQKGTRATLIY